MINFRIRVPINQQTELLTVEVVEPNHNNMNNHRHCSQSMYVERSTSTTAPSMLNVPTTSDYPVPQRSPESIPAARQ